MIVGQRDRQGIGGVGRLRPDPQLQLPLYRQLHLFFARMTAAGQHALHPIRQIMMNLKACLSGGESQRTSTSVPEVAGLSLK